MTSMIGGGLPTKSYGHGFDERAFNIRGVLQETPRFGDGGMGLTLPLLLASVWMWASAEERVARRAESLSDRSVARTTAGTPSG